MLPDNVRRLRARALLSYVMWLAAGVGVYLAIRLLGESLGTSHGASQTVSHQVAHSSTLWHVLLALAVITGCARATGSAFERWLGQPAVMGEIVAGLLLGPSALGWVSPEAMTFLMPPETAPLIGIIAKIGVVLFMFLVGLELDLSTLRKHHRTTLLVSHASIVTPFVLGSGLALFMYRSYASATVSFTVFSLFIGVAMSVTAFPVLARVLTDRRMQYTSIGVMALACAAIDDVTAWSLLALVAGVANANVAGAAMTIAATAAYGAVMMLVVKPALTRFLARRESNGNDVLSGTTLAVVVIGVLLSSAATEAIGIHALFGSFLLGAILPHDSGSSAAIRVRLHDVVVVFLLPVFFAFTGMRFQLGMLHSAHDWLMTLAIIGVATTGKFFGTLFAARLTGQPWRSGALLGILMNTRGLMELIVLNVGLDLGVISPTVFAMMVLMALVTTFTTSPILGLLWREGSREGAVQPTNSTPALR